MFFIGKTIEIYDPIFDTGRLNTGFNDKETLMKFYHDRYNEQFDYEPIYYQFHYLDLSINEEFEDAMPYDDNFEENYENNPAYKEYMKKKEAYKFEAKFAMTYINWANRRLILLERLCNDLNQARITAKNFDDQNPRIAEVESITNAIRTIKTLINDIIEQKNYAKKEAQVEDFEISVVCKYCGGQMNNPTGRREYCSDSCRVMAYNKRKNKGR